jgi:hypothetical protein
VFHDLLIINKGSNSGVRICHLFYLSVNFDANFWVAAENLIEKILRNGKAFLLFWLYLFLKYV